MTKQCGEGGRKSHDGAQAEMYWEMVVSGQMECLSVDQTCAVKSMKQKQLSEMVRTLQELGATEEMIAEAVADFNEGWDERLEKWSE